MVGEGEKTLEPFEQNMSPQRMAILTPFDLEDLFLGFCRHLKRDDEIKVEPKVENPWDNAGVIVTDKDSSISSTPKGNL